MIKQLVAVEVCLKCQGCCRFRQIESIWSPRLLNDEIQDLLKNHILPSVISFDKSIRLIPHGAQNDTFICGFLNTKDNVCKIYSHRPFECQLYPFLINRREGKVFLALDLRCPFVKENSETPGFKGYVQYLIGLLNDPQGTRLLKNNPQVIQEYPGVLNLAELKI